MVILLRYSERPEGRVALASAVEEAQRRDAKLVIAQGRPSRPGDNQRQVTAWLNDLEHLKAEGASLEARLREQGIDAKFRLLEESDASPAEQFLSVAQKLDASLIVIGIRRRSPVGKLVLGSGSQEILLRAECPVLAVKALED